MKNSIDKNLIAILIILNMKGYKTLFSCGGHSDRDFTNIYIYFNKDISHLEPPEDFRVEKAKFGSIIRFYPIPHDEKDIKKHIKLLKEWSVKL